MNGGPTDPGESASRGPLSTSGPLPPAAWSVDCDVVHPNPARPNHDKPETVDPPFAGAPLGGFGAGTFARTYRGDFARWHLRTGHHHYQSIPSCLQAVAVQEGDRCLDAFALGPKPTDGSMSDVTFRTTGIQYHALYPRSWYEGDAASGQITWRLTQFSPIIPNNYRETSLPAAVFRWHVRNTGKRPLQVSILTSWENLSIVEPGATPTTRSIHVVPEAVPSILWLGRGGAIPHSEEDGAFAIAGAGGTPFVIPLFDAAGSGESLWEALTDPRSKNGIPGADRQQVAQDTGRCAGALGIRAEIAPGETREIAFSLAWHFPVFTFGSGRQWYRRYTHFYARGVGRGDLNDPACRIAADALRARDTWETEIDDWQRPILDTRPAPLSRLLFNSLYILADGGTAWENGEVLPRDADEEYVGAPPVPGSRDVGRFSILECFTYPYYATLDVRYYGGLPLLFLWPELERQVLLQYAAAATAVDTEKRDMVHVQESATRKRAGTLPHDLGAPDEDPWVKVNAYDDIDPNRWKDLGPKFVLQVARYMASVGWEDRGFLRGVWPAVASAMRRVSDQDRDGDGLPENEGIPDQTFDKWPMTGPGAYCSDLAVAALTAAEEIAEWCGDPGAARRYGAWRKKAVRAIQKKLWREDHLVYDQNPENEGLVMAGQLSGDWSLAMLGLPSVLELEQVKKTLETIWASCQWQVDGRLWGLKNGGPRYGNEWPDNRHAAEIWPGINFAIASHMILMGMRREAGNLVGALARVIYEDRPFAFMVPEAWDGDGNFRGALYMRPMSVWAVEEALRRAETSGGLRSFFAVESAD